MKYSLFSIFFLICLNSCSHNASKIGFIEFIHVGPQDKSIEPIIISKRDLEQYKEPPYSIGQYIYVDEEKNYDKIYNYLTSIPDSRKMVLDIRDVKFGTFKILLTKDEKNYSYYLIGGRKQSVIFFQDLIKFMAEHKTGKDLQDGIEKILLPMIIHPQPAGTELED